MNSLPKISVITVVYNNDEHIEQTIRSVASQTYSNIEYIVIDGASKDETVPIIKNNLEPIDIFISEQDKGIYDAMNKGISLCSGEFIIFMNSGDVFTKPETLAQIIESADVNTDLIYGDFIADYGNGLVKLMKAKNIGKIEKGMIFSHQALLAKSCLLKEYPFNLQYKIAADFDFVYSCYKKQAKFQHIPIPVAKITTGGISDGNHKVLSEYLNIVSKWDNNKIIKFQINLRKWEIKFRNMIKTLMPKQLVSLIRKISH